MRLLLILTLVLAGCAHPNQHAMLRDELVGNYTNGDPYWPRSLELNVDGTFDYRQLTDVIGADGSLEGSWEFSGSWKFFAPDRIELTSERRKEPVLVFARLSRKTGIAILEPDLFPTILRDWSDDRGFGFLRRWSPKKPNQALQHNDPSCHAPCVRTCRASRGRG